MSGALRRDDHPRAAFARLSVSAVSCHHVAKLQTQLREGPPLFFFEEAKLTSMCALRVSFKDPNRTCQAMVWL